MLHGLHACLSVGQVKNFETNFDEVLQAFGNLLRTSLYRHSGRKKNLHHQSTDRLIAILQRLST